MTSSTPSNESIVENLIRGFGPKHPSSKKLQARDLTVIRDFEALSTPEVLKRAIINGLMKEWGLLVEDDETASRVLSDLRSVTEFDPIEQQTLDELKAVADAGTEDEIDASILTNLVRIDAIGRRLEGHLEHQLRFRETIVHLLATFQPDHDLEEVTGDNRGDHEGSMETRP